MPHKDPVAKRAYAREYRRKFVKTPKGKLDTENCHDTKRVRGLLCGKCNRGIGLFHDDSIILRNAADYIDKAK